MISGILILESTNKKRGLFIKKNIIFDLDDTLYLHDMLRSDVKQGIHKILEREEIDKEQVWDAYKRLEPGLFHQFLNNEITGQGYMLKRYSVTLESMGCMESESIGCRLQESYLEQIDKIKDTEDAKTVLNKLKEEGYALYLLTNGPVQAQKRKLKVLGITNYFDGIYISEGMQIAKSSKFAFEHVLKNEGLAVSDTVVVGDSIKYDIVPSISMGLQAIFLKRHVESDCGEELKNTICINELREVLKVLD